MASSNPVLSLEALAASLEFLATRLDTVERENQSLRAELAVSRAAPTSAADHASPTPLERLSRRWLLRRGMQLTAASVAAGVLVQRTAFDASAHHSDDVVRAYFVNTHLLSAASNNGTSAVEATSNSSAEATIYAHNAGTMPAVYGESHSANGAIEGTSLNADGSGVWGTGRNGVIGVSSHGSGSGVYGTNTNNVGVTGDGAVGVKGTSSKSNYAAVAGDHTGSVGYGVSGVGKGAAAGVLGRNAAGEGVLGEGRVGVKGKGPAYVGVHGEGLTGVWGTTSSPDYSGVYGQSNSSGYGVYGTSPSKAGVHGDSAGGFGVEGEGRTGVRGKATGVAGYGGQFEGGKAQLRIVPMTTAGKPTSGTHAKGELVLDSAAVLWICTVGGTPGTWRKFTTAPS